MNNRIKQLTTIFITALMLIGALSFMAKTGTAQEPITAQAGEDLSIETLTLTTSSTQTLTPYVYEPVTVTIKARNIGTASISGRRIYLYVDPPQPPLTTTKATKEFIAAIVWPPGDPMSVEYANFTFSTPGNHKIYAWVDPLERIAETNESNNLSQLTLNVLPDPSTDSNEYEPDNECVQAKQIQTDGTVQTRTFEPDDEDWVKFNITAGTTYTMTVTGTGPKADPVFEIWETCTRPDQSFGSFRQTVLAPVTGTYYLRLENDEDPTDNKKENYTYRLSIQSSSSAKPVAVAPNITGISPSSGNNNLENKLVIKGSNFKFPPLIEVCRGDSNCSECTQLLKQANFIDSTQIEATVQTNLRPGAYCVATTNPDGQRFITQNVFTLTSTAPILQYVTPIQGGNDVPVDINFNGFRLFANDPTLSIKLGSTSLINITGVMSGTHLQATIPPNIPSGLYTITVSYGTGKTATLPNAYTVLITAEQDLYAQSQELWVNPVAPRAGATARMGLLVHHRGGANTLTDVPVEFQVNGVKLDTTAVPLLTPGTEGATYPVSWTPSQSGTYEIKAIINPNGQFPETTTANNSVIRTVTVIAAASDSQSPHVDSLAVRDRQNNVITNTTKRLVFLSGTASDPSPGSPIRELRYLELEYSQGAQLWTPVWDSGWLINNTVNASFYRHRLTPVSGIHYIQLWAKDGAGNISLFPYQRSINYLPPTGIVGRNQSRIYRQHLAKGEALAVTLTPLSGDPDLYIWPPDYTDGRPPWVSNLSGNGAVDAVSLTAAPVAGEYQIEVYGYGSAQYQLDITTGTGVAAVDLRTAVGGEDPTKTQLTTPVISLSSQPPTSLDSTASQAAVYLPVIIK